MSPPPEIVIRAREPSDMADVNEIFAQPRAVWGTLQTPYVSLEERQKWAAQSRPGSRHLVAVVDGKAVGAAHLERYPERRVHVGALGMAVHDAYAGRGVGTALMAALVELADEWLQIRRLELNVYSDNARAIALYERFGFAREGLLRDYAWREGAYVDSIPMARLRP